MKLRNSSVRLSLQWAFRAAIVMFVAVLFGHYSALTEAFWIPLATVFMLQAVSRLNSRQGLQRLLFIILGVLAVTYLLFYLTQLVWVGLVATFFLSVIAYFAFIQEARIQAIISLMAGVIVLIAFIFPPSAQYFLHARMIDIMVGGVIGLIGGVLVVPVSTTTEFISEVIPLLNACSQYLSIIQEYLFDRTLEDKLIAVKDQLEQHWRNFPDWIYEPGFTAILQQGHRHFLVRIEQIRQILYAINYLVRFDYDKATLEALQESMRLYVLELEKLFQAIAEVLGTQKLTKEVGDVTEHFYAFEKVVNDIIPVSQAGLEINQEYVYLANLADQLKELGKMLLILSQTLR